LLIEIGGKRFLKFQFRAAPSGPVDDVRAVIPEGTVRPTARKYGSGRSETQ
jgi:hypothetical protein